MSNVVTINPEILSGMPVFTGTRVPIKNLFDYIEGGHSLADFLDDFPSVTKSQVEKLFQELGEEIKSAA
jgi:uncharacterized protein (DUF433 family)